MHMSLILKSSSVSSSYIGFTKLKKVPEGSTSITPNKRVKETPVAKSNSFFSLDLGFMRDFTLVPFFNFSDKLLWNTCWFIEKAL